MRKPITILISGAIATGKSTIAAHGVYYFRERLGEAAILSTDECWRMFDPDWKYEGDWGSISEEYCFASAKWLLQHGVDVVVIEGLVLHEEDAVREALRTVGSQSIVYHVTLEAELEVVIERVRQRGNLDYHTPDFLSGQLDAVRQHHHEWTHVIDNSAITPRETLDRIYEHTKGSERTSDRPFFCKCRIPSGDNTPWLSVCCSFGLI